MEIEAVTLSTCLFLFTILLHIFICRLFGSDRGVAWMFLSFAVYFVALTAIWIFKHDFDSSLITLFTSAGFWCLSYMEAFSMLCRGFSLSILVHLSEKPSDSTSSVVLNYGGVGAEGLLEKRLASLTSLKFIEIKDNTLTLQGTTARFISLVTSAYKKILNLGRGG